MAQMGSWIPARSARLGIADRIFTRVGAGDDLAAGLEVQRLNVSGGVLNTGGNQVVVSDRMLLAGYVMGIRSERWLCEEVHLNLAYRWFCRLDPDGA